MDKLLGVVRVDDFGEGKNGLGDVAAMLAAAAGDGEFVGLITALHRVENDVLLKHAVMAESGLAGFKNVESAQLQMPQEVLAEGAEVRAVAKTPWRDADELPAGNQEPLNERNEAGVEVAGFDADGTEGAPLGGVGADFPIGRIGDGGIEGRRQRAEQITRETSRHFLDEVG